MGHKIRPNTKWFSYERAVMVKGRLRERGVETKIVKTTKINKLFPVNEQKRPAWLIQKVEA